MEESSMDDIHRWHFHPWMTFLHLWMTSMDNISPSMEWIFSYQVFGKKCLHHVLNEFVSNCLLALYFHRSYKKVCEQLETNSFKKWCKQFLPKIWQMKTPSLDGETSSMDESAILGCHSWMEKCHPWMERCHPWMEKCHPWMSSMDGEMSSMDGEMSSMDGEVSSMDGEMPSMDVIHGWRNVIHGWKCHLWMLSMDDIHGWRRRMTDMDAAIIELLHCNENPK